MKKQKKKKKQKSELKSGTIEMRIKLRQSTNIKYSLYKPQDINNICVKFIH